MPNSHLRTMIMENISDIMDSVSDIPDTSKEIAPFFHFLEPRTDVNETGKRLSLLITSTHLDIFINYYIFPIQFFFGVVGNSINLMVLLSRSMRSKANLLLAAMALSDIGTFLTWLIFSITVYEPVYTNNTFRAVFFTFRQNLNAIGNFFSTATCWFVLAVSLERYLGIRSPMHTRLGHSDRQIFLLILLIFIGSFLVSSFHNFEYDTGFYWNRNHTYVYPVFNNVRSLANSSTVSSSVKLKAAFVGISKSVSIFAVIIIPQIAIVFLNISIIRILRNRNLSVARFDSQGRDNKDFLRQRQERKVTATVAAIITCFSVTNSPSVTPFVIEVIGEMYGINTVSDKKYKALYYYAVPLLTTWTLTGRMMNFVLFCMSSAHFRRRLREMLLGKLTGRYSSMLTSGSQYGLYKSGTTMRMSSLDHNGTIRRHLSSSTQVEFELDTSVV